MAGHGTPQVNDLRREIVRTPDEVAAMLRLRALGWGTRRIAAEFGCSRNTVTRYVGLGGWAPPRVARRPRTLTDVASLTDESKQLAKELKRRGFAFVGPTTVYSTMQAVGLVNDHLAGCFVRDEVEAAQRNVQRLSSGR